MKKITEQEAIDILHKRGHPSTQTYRLAAKQTKELHSHPYDADAILISGQFIVMTRDQEYKLGPGDEIQLAAGTMHSEEVGNTDVVLVAATPDLTMAED